MPRIWKVVKNVKHESKQNGYDPATGTNWCHLPMEIREKCIRDMNFLTRTRLRSTSVIEKSLVDSTKYRFSRVEIIYSDNKIEVAARNEKQPRNRKEIGLRNRRTPEKRFECVLNILKTCDIRSVQFIDGGVFEDMKDEFLDKFRAIAPFGFRRLTVEGMQMKAILMMLENCGPLERLTLSLYGPDHTYEQIVDIPAVINTPEVRMTHSASHICPLWELVQKWIENDAPIGKSLQFVSNSPGVFVSFASKFGGRVIESDGKNTTRIGMNGSKHILLRKIGSHRRPSDEGSVRNLYMSCKIIDAGLPKSEYAVGDKWIESLFIANDPILSITVPYDLDSDESEHDDDNCDEESEEGSEDSSDSEKACDASEIISEFLRNLEVNADEREDGSENESDESEDDEEDEPGLAERFMAAFFLHQYMNRETSSDESEDSENSDEFDVNNYDNSVD